MENNNGGETLPGNYESRKTFFLKLVHWNLKTRKIKKRKYKNFIIRKILKLENNRRTFQNWEHILQRKALFLNFTFPCKYFLIFKFSSIIFSGNIFLIFIFLCNKFLDLKFLCILDPNIFFPIYVFTNYQSLRMIFFENICLK